MKRVPSIILTVSVFAIPICPASGKELRDPEPLTFSKHYDMQEADADSIRGIIHLWNSSSCGLVSGGYTYHLRNEGGKMHYDRVEIYNGGYNINAHNKKVLLNLFIEIRIGDGCFDMDAVRISADWRNHFVSTMSTCDDKFNRTWLWRIQHSPKVLDQIRLRAAEIFGRITASMDRFLAEGPPLEMRETQ